MATEIERKWRIPWVPPKICQQYGIKGITQGYLVVNDDGEVRLRNEGSEFSLTFKGRGALARPEENYRLLTRLGFDLLWPNIIGEPIVKKRLCYPNVMHPKYEIDLYEGFAYGLIIVEKEFPDLESAHVFTLPDWFVGAVEVTEDRRYKNQYLALHATTIRQELELPQSNGMSLD